MMPMRMSPLLLILSTAAFAADPAVIVQPESIQLSTTANFDDQGVFRRSQSQLRLEVKIIPPAGMQLASSRGVRISEAVSDSGESLVPKGTDRGSGNGEETFNEWERERNDYDVAFNLANPVQPITAIRSVKGTLILAVAAGAAKQATIAPLTDWLGKAVALESIDEEITVARTAEGTSLRGSRALFDRLQKVTFADGAGREIKANGWSGGSDGQEFHRTWTVKVPDDGAITLQFLPELAEQEVAFSLADLPLKAVGGERKPAVRLKVTDVSADKPEKPKADGVKDPNAKAAGF